MLVVGSAALKYHRGFEARQVNDIDLIVFPDELPELVKFQKPSKVEVVDESHLVLRDCNNAGFKAMWQPTHNLVEVEIAWPGSVAERILGNVSWRGTYELASLDCLYSLKMSHRYRKNSPHFEKTRRDIIRMREFGAGKLLSWFKDREAETYAYNHPNLSAGQMKENFFNGDGVKYFFDHDFVHTVVARIYNSNVPAYTLYLREGEAVACDREKFENLSFQERIRGVCEEATVLALERSQIPCRLDPAFSKTVSSAWSYKYALQKVCTSITSGWFREFAWENYDEALSAYRRDYSVEFWRAVENSGLVSRDDGSVGV